jgi:hypothetical protein
MPQPRAIVPDAGGIRVGVNNTGATIPKYRLVKKGTNVVALQAGVDSVTPAVDGVAIVYGATMAAILNGYGGDVQVEGRALVEAAGAINIGDEITGGAGGKAAVSAGGVHIFGQAASPALVDGDIIEVDVIRTIG